MRPEFCELGRAWDAVLLDPVLGSDSDVRLAQASLDSTLPYQIDRPSLELGAQPTLTVSDLATGPGPRGQVSHATVVGLSPRFLDPAAPLPAQSSLAQAVAPVEMHGADTSKPVRLNSLKALDPAALAGRTVGPLTSALAFAPSALAG